MNCKECKAELAEGTKFCTECGARVDDSSSGQCGECGETLKPDAMFCHACGAATGRPASRQSAAAHAGPASGQPNWLASYGAFLFIPIFAAIIVTLFWVNKEPEHLAATDRGGEQASAASMGDVHNTLTRLQERLESNPEDLVAMDSLAVMYSIAGNYEKALEYYDRHLKVEPDNKDINIARALTLHSLKRSDEAMDILQGVLKADPTYKFALHYLAEIQATLGHKDLAEKNWQKIIDTYPDTEWAKMAQQRMHEVLHADEGSN